MTIRDRSREGAHEARLAAGGRDRASGRRWRLALASLLVAAVFADHRSTAFAAKVTDVPADQDRIEITALGEFIEGRAATRLQIETARRHRRHHRPHVGARRDARHQSELDGVRAAQSDRQADRALAHGRALQRHRLRRDLARSRRAPHRGGDAVGRLRARARSRATAPTSSASRSSPARPSPIVAELSSTGSRASICGSRSSTSQKRATGSSSTASCSASPACWRSS